MRHRAKTAAQKAVLREESSRQLGLTKANGRSGRTRTCDPLLRRNCRTHNQQFSAVCMNCDTPVFMRVCRTSIVRETNADNPHMGTILGTVFAVAPIGL
jgi:hypothetical protein